MPHCLKEANVKAMARCIALDIDAPTNAGGWRDRRTARESAPARRGRAGPLSCRGR